MSFPDVRPPGRSMGCISGGCCIRPGELHTRGFRLAGQIKRDFSVDLGTVLLDADEIDDVMGTSGSEVLDEGNAPDDTIEANPPECHGVVYIAGEIEYASTNFTAMRWRIVGAENVGAVVEMVAQLPSVAKADQFIDQANQGVGRVCGRRSHHQQRQGEYFDNARPRHRGEGTSSHRDRINRSRCQARGVAMASMSCRRCRTSFST